MYYACPFGPPKLRGIAGAASTLIFPLLALGVTLVITKLISEYENALEDKTITREDLEKEMRIIQLGLGRLIDLKVVNDRFESTEQIEKIKLSINGVEIRSRIEELTSRIEAIRELLKKIPK